MMANLARAALAAAAALGGCSPSLSLQEMRAQPAERVIMVSAPADRLAPCLGRLLGPLWAARGGSVDQAMTANGRFAEIVARDRDGMALLIEASTRMPYASRVEMRARRGISDADINRVATIAEACSS